MGIGGIGRGLCCVQGLFVCLFFSCVVSVVSTRYAEQEVPCSSRILMAHCFSWLRSVVQGCVNCVELFGFGCFVANDSTFIPTKLCLKLAFWFSYVPLAMHQAMQPCVDLVGACRYIVQTHSAMEFSQ